MMQPYSNQNVAPIFFLLFFFFFFLLRTDKLKSKRRRASRLVNGFQNAAPLPSGKYSAENVRKITVFSDFERARSGVGIFKPPPPPSPPLPSAAAASSSRILRLHPPRRSP